MAKFTSAIVAVALCLVTLSSALPRQYRYYPPSHSRFAGWTVTSQELLALPSTNEHNIVRIAPPADFIRPHHISRRAIETVVPNYAFLIPDVDDMLNYS